MCALGLSKGVSQEVVRTGQEPVLLVLPYQHQAALESCCALGMFLSSRHDAPWDPSTGRGWLPTCPGSSAGNGLGSKSIFARDGRNVILITQEIKSFWILEVQIAFFLFCFVFCLYGSISKTDGKAEIYILLSAEGWCTGPYLLVGTPINLPAGDLNPVALIGRAVRGTRFMLFMNFMSNVRFFRCRNDQGMAL